MNFYGEIPQIDEWFNNGVVENTVAKNFFEVHDVNNDIFFWPLFTLVEVISIVSTNINAAYLAYHNNYSGFGDFCDEAWHSYTLNYSKLNLKTIRDYLFIKQLFPKTTSVILGDKIPFFILKQFSNINNITFTTSHRTKVGFRKMGKITKLTILNSEPSCIIHEKRGNAITNFFTCFRKVGELTLIDSHLLWYNMEQLESIKFNSLILRGIVLDWCMEIPLAESILNAGDGLVNLEIIAGRYEFNVLETIEYILTHINWLENLKSLTISAYFTEKFLKPLKNAIGLDKLKIIEYDYSFLYPRLERGKILDILGDNIPNIDIITYSQE